MKKKNVREKFNVGDLCYGIDWQGGWNNGEPFVIAYRFIGRGKVESIKDGEREHADLISKSISGAIDQWICALGEHCGRQRLPWSLVRAISKLARLHDRLASRGLIK